MISKNNRFLCNMSHPTYQLIYTTSNLRLHLLYFKINNHTFGAKDCWPMSRLGLRMSFEASFPEKTLGKVLFWRRNE